MLRARWLARRARVSVARMSEPGSDPVTKAAQSPKLARGLQGVILAAGKGKRIQPFSQ